MNSTESLCDTLIWTFSGVGAPDFDGLEEETLLYAVHKHRAEARLWHRIRSSDIRMSGRMRDEIEQRYRAIAAHTKSQLVRFEQLRKALMESTGEERVVPLKGFGLYALTGDEKHIRYSGDLDLIGADSDQVMKAALTLSQEGYHHHGEEHPYVYAHMKYVEVHFRYVVTGFSAGQSRADYDPRDTSGVMLLPRSFDEASIVYGDVAATTVQAGPYGTSVPGPEMAALIRCAHIYVGYAMNPRPMPLATVRLEELAQLIDLAALPAFDLGRFQNLCMRFRADLVVGFARRLCRELLRRDPFAPSGGAAPLPVTGHEWFPTNLWWDGLGAGFPVWLGWSPRDLLVRSPDVPDLVAALRPMLLPVGTGQTASVKVAGPDRTPAVRVIALNHCEEMAFAAADFGFLPDALRVTVSLPRTADDRMSVLGLASGDTRVELFFKPRENLVEFSDWSVQRLPSELCAYSASVDGECHALTIALPWSAFGRQRRPARGEKIDVLVRARQQVRPWGAVTSGWVLPVRLGGSE